MTFFPARLASFASRSGAGRWAAVLLAALGSCRPAPEAPLLTEDFESLGSWLHPAPAWLTSVRAHSGQYALLASAREEFGAAYRTTWQGLDQAHRLRLRTWAWLPHGRIKVALVLVVQYGPDVKYWRSLSVGHDVSRFQQWEPVQRDFVLPGDLLPTDEVKLYVWQTSSTREDIYLDDLVLEKIN